MKANHRHTQTMSSEPNLLGTVIKRAVGRVIIIYMLYMHTYAINNEAKTIARKLQLDSRIERFSDKNAFVTIKDYKENFPNNLKCHLINPAKLPIGIVSKQILKKINNIIRSQSNFNQWRNTYSVISWFRSKQKRMQISQV